MEEVAQTSQGAAAATAWSLPQLSMILQLTSTTQALAVMAVIGVAALTWSRRRYKLPPGPRGYPLLGNLLDMNSTTESFFVQIHRWSKQFGPVISFYMGPKLVVAINSPETAIEAFVKKGEDFGGRPKIRSLEYISEGFKDIGLSDSGPAWKHRRKIYVNAQRHYMTGTHLQDIVNQGVTMMTDAMLKENKGAFDPRFYNCKLMFRIMEAVCFGGGVKSFQDEYLNYICEVFRSFNAEIGNGFYEDIIPLLHKWPTKRYKNIMGKMDEFLAYLYKHIGEHREGFDPKNMGDLTDAFLMAQQEAIREMGPEVAKDFTDTHVVQAIMDIIGAGTDNPRFSLDWMTLLMAGYPEVQKRCQEEIDAVSGDRSVEDGDRPGLQYTQAVMLEIYRFGVVTPLSLPHMTLKDTTVGGYDVPKNTLVLMNQWAFLHDPDIWPEAHLFKPERFLDENGRCKKIKEWMTPFSFGTRNCLGQSVAKPEMLLIFAGLFKRLNIRLAPGQELDLHNDITFGMEHCNCKPFQVVISRRWPKA